MRSSKARPKATPTSKSAEPALLVVSIGCPAGIGPEVSVRAAAALREARCVLVGDAYVISRAAELTGVASDRLVPFDGSPPPRGRIAVLHAGPKLKRRDVIAGQPTPMAGQAQLEYIEQAYALVAGATRARRTGATQAVAQRARTSNSASTSSLAERSPRLPSTRALVTGPVSKAAIAHSGLQRARKFLGHTEWLRDLDGKASSVMCFHSPKLVASLVTTHLPISAVPAAINSRDVATASIELARLLLRLRIERPRIAICSLNPHAGESELLGQEERRAILPGLKSAQRKLGELVELIGPVGAETAFRKAYAGGYHGVVAMYHDQATIPLKLIAFGDAVNVTLGLSIVRTSVDHGTAYDIAWQGRADANGMLAAMRLAARLVEANDFESAQASE